MSPPARTAEADRIVEAETSGAAPFSRRHNGPGPSETASMLADLGFELLDDLIERAVPNGIRLDRRLQLPEPASEHQALEELRHLAEQNHVVRSLLGMGYAESVLPPVIRRNILENPGWYTAYTPYQAEIAQGRLEMLLNFQTLILDLTGLEIANASLLDEATAAAEAMTLSLAASKRKEEGCYFVAEDCHPQTLEVLRTRAWPLAIEIASGPWDSHDFSRPTFGALVQYPATDGAVRDYRELVERAHAAGALVTVAADPLALTLLTPPGEMGADVAVGSSQRLGLPMGYGGPHAAYFATRERYKRLVPGRVVGVSQDADGRPALRLALQTREQHIRRDKATSNICTAQVLPAVLAAAYALYHGPEGLAAIAGGIHDRSLRLAAGLAAVGYDVDRRPLFDTVHIRLEDRDEESGLLASARAAGFNLRGFGNGRLGITLDEVSTEREVETLVEIFAARRRGVGSRPSGHDDDGGRIPAELRRRSTFLTHPIFHSYRSETELLRYLARLEAKDLSLTTSMIPLGSCTMKLNAAVEMLPVTWPGFARPHPFAPLDQAEGYRVLVSQLEEWLAEITGFAAVSLQPNAGSQGEYSGLLVIRRYHERRGEEARDVCLIPESAHGTNPASAVMAGLRVVVVRCDDAGNIDVEDLRARAAEHADRLAALMVTYPSTHGVFEEEIREICAILHRHGGQVYLDGANMNAQVGLCRPGDYGADVCHLNLHKTFCIPHGGGGPGMGPIGVAEHLAPYLPGHSVVGLGGEESLGAVSAAPWGSGAILPISWAYIRLMGADGLSEASRIAILNANYVAHRLAPHYPVLYRGRSGLVAHECILDLRPLKRSAKVEVEDVAKRLMDYGFHAPTVSWPVAGTMMVEPTESESRAELDRFCDAMIAIRHEVTAIEEGRVAVEESALRHAPHTAADVTRDSWQRPYSRQQAAFPAAWTREHKYWPPTRRIDNAYGDRHLVCSCPPIGGDEEA